MGEKVDIKLFKYNVLLSKASKASKASTVPIEKFTMAIHDHYIISAKGNVFNSEPRMRFRRWKTKENGQDLDPHRGLKSGTDSCKVCHF